MYTKTLLVTVTPNTRNLYSDGTNLEYWYRRLKASAVGPEGMRLNLSRLKARRNTNSSIVDTKVEITA